MGEPKFSVIRRPARGRLPAGSYAVWPEPIGADILEWNRVIMPGLSEDEALRTAAELNAAADVIES